MILNPLGRWWRARLRRSDAKHLWPVIGGWHPNTRCERPSVKSHAYCMALWHIRNAPHWRYPEEWEGTPEDPRVWFKERRDV